MHCNKNLHKNVRTLYNFKILLKNEKCQDFNKT